MTIDMHSHWFPEKLADAFRQRKSKPMIHTKADGIEYMESMFSAPLRTEQLDKRLAEMDRTGVERGVISLTTVFGVEGLPAEEAIPLCRINNDGLSEICAKYPDRFSRAGDPAGRRHRRGDRRIRARHETAGHGRLSASGRRLSVAQARRTIQAAARGDRPLSARWRSCTTARPPTTPIRSRSIPPTTATRRVGTLDMQARLSQNMITFCMTDFMKSFPNMTMLSHNLGGNIPFEIERMDHRTMIDLPPGTELPSKKFRRAPVLVDCNSLGARSIELAAEVYGAEKIVFGSDGTGFGMEWTQKAINDARISESDREAIRHANAARAIAKVKRPMQVAAE